MAYIPPHKRHTKENERPTPTPDLLVPQFKKNLNPGSSRPNFESKGKHILPGGKIIYANQAISRWCAVGLTDDNQFPPSVSLDSISLDFSERKKGEKPVALINSQVAKDNNEAKGNFWESSGISLVEAVLPDLLSAYQNVRNEMDHQELGEVKPSLVARFGKILFYGGPSINLETVRKCSVGESSSGQLKRSFYTNITATYMEYIMGGVVPLIGVHFEAEKEFYHVKLSDNSRPDSIISCKCRVVKDGKKLECFKAGLNPLRHLVIDISCLDKNLDLRLMLYTKRILIALSDEEKDSIKDIISCAILDPDAKGGLRWPLGKESCGGRYNVVGAWHTKGKTYKNSSMRLKVRHADRFDFKTSSGEVTSEVTITMKGLVSELHEQKIETNSVFDKLKDSFKLIWDHFLSGDGFLA